uniref:Uncharacterized protein n=1 Tax=Arundo donax TaxID=35708 RepID=A0A0A8Y303_ARUDO
MSFSATRRSRPMTWSNSSVTLPRTLGFLRSSEMTHSTVTAEVSVPPVISSRMNALTLSRSIGTSRLGSSASCSSRSTMSIALMLSSSRRRRSLC